MKTRVMASVLALAVVCTLGACGGGGDDSGDDAATTTTAAATATTEAAAELPQFSTEFDRVCTTQVGFPGAKSYEPTPGLHPVMLLEEYRGKNYVTSSRQLPQGWTIKEDTNFEDNAELAGVELVACSDQVKQTPTGKQCDFDDDGEKVRLELVAATYELTIYATTTAKEIAKTTIEARDDDCPTIAAFQKGDTTFVATPEDDDYIAALKPHVAP